MSRAAVASPSPCYRLRDLVACVVVLQVGLTFVWALQLNQVDEKIAIAFGLAVLALLVTFSLGWVVDRIGTRLPLLVRPRRCPLVLLVGVMAAAVAIPTRDDQVVTWLHHQVQWATHRAQPLTDEARIWVSYFM